MAIALNPAAGRLGLENAVLWGRGRQHHVREFAGPLSIKTVLKGTAEWRAGDARFELDANSYLLLNDGQRYTITVDSNEPVETLCLFFARGFVEDAWKSVTQPVSSLLDDPALEAQIGFYERLRRKDDHLLRILGEIQRGARAGDVDEELFYRAALLLCGLRGEVAREMGRLPAVRASTREELHKRVLRAKQALDESFTEQSTLADIARQACLSPFHLHRAFTAAFHETPHAYRTRRRLERAARMLAETDGPVIEICLACGFESPASFATLFRRRFERSPRQFREFARSDKNAGLIYGRMLP